MCFFEGAASSRGNFDNYLPYISQIEITVNDLANKILRVAISEVDACKQVVLSQIAEPEDEGHSIVLKKMSWLSAFGMSLGELCCVQNAYVKAPISGFMVLAEDEDAVLNVRETLKGILGRAYQLFMIKNASEKQALIGCYEHGSAPNELQEMPLSRKSDL